MSSKHIGDGRLTFFNAILLWSLVVRVLMLLGDSLGTFVEMMLVADALT